MTEVKLPSLASGVDKANVSYWYKSPGDMVKIDEDLVELVTDKATFNMPSPVSGKISKVLVNEGEEAKVGETLAIIE